MRSWLLVLAGAATIVALLFARPHPTPGPPMRDFEAYYAAGTLWNDGRDPYSQAIWSAERRLSGVDGGRYEALPFVGPPALLPVFGVLARMPFVAANALWRGLLIASLAALAFLTLRLTQRRIDALSLFAIAVAALGFGPLTSALALGQIALPAFLFAVLALSSPPVGLLAWAQPNVALAMLPQLFTKRAPVFLGGAALFVTGCALVAGIGGVEHYAGVLHAHSLAERFSAIQITPASIAYGFGANGQTAIAAGTVIALAAICCWALLMRAAAGTLERFCATCALLPLATPFFHEHDLLVLFVPGVVYAVRANSRLWPLASFGAMLAATDWLGLAQRPDGTLQTLLLVGAFGAVLVALSERPHVRMLLVPAAVLVLVGGAAFLAHAHPAPVWPDAMGALPHNVGTLPISDAWNAQQRASGLLAQNPVWALLRACSLLGCVLTAYAIAASSRYPAGSKNPLPGLA